MFKSNELHKIAEFGTIADADAAVDHLQRRGIDAWTARNRRVAISHCASPTPKSLRVRRSSCTYATVGYLKAAAARHDTPVVDVQDGEGKLRKDVDAPGLRAYPIYRTLQEAAEARGIYGPNDLAK